MYRRRYPQRSLPYRDRYRQEQRRKFLYKIYFVLFLTVLTVGGIGYLLFFGRLFDIREITIKGNEILQTADIQNITDKWLDQKRLMIAHRANIFFISSQDLKSKLSDDFPRIVEVKIQRKDRHALDLTIVENKTEYIYCVSQDRCFQLDKTGLAFAESAPSSGAIYIRIDDERDITIDLGDHFDKPELFENFVILSRLANDQNLSLKNFVIPKDRFDEFEIITTLGWKIILNSTIDPIKQMTSFLAFYKQKMTTDQRDKLQYVDLRIPDRIYFQ